MRKSLGAHPATGVLDSELDVRGTLSWRCWKVASPNHDPATVRHRVAPVGGKIEQDLLNLRRIHLDEPERRIQLGPELDVFSDEASQQSLHAADDFVE